MSKRPMPAAFMPRNVTHRPGRGGCGGRGIGGRGIGAGRGSGISQLATRRPENDSDIVSAPGTPHSSLHSSSSPSLSSAASLAPVNLLVPAAALAGPCRSLGDFEVLSQLGKGEFGVVKRAREKSSPSPSSAAAAGAAICIKELTFDFSREGFPIEAVRELGLLSELAHPNIVRAISILCGDSAPSASSASSSSGGGNGDGDGSGNGSGGSGFGDMGRWFLVMEAAELDLGTLLLGSSKGFPLNEGQVKDLSKQLLSGVAAIHARGVMHRDLKPANCLLTQRGVLKVCDFGLARRVGPSAAECVNLEAQAAAVGLPSFTTGLASGVAPRGRLFAQAEKKRRIAAKGVTGGAQGAIRETISPASAAAAAAAAAAAVPQQEEGGEDALPEKELESSRDKWDEASDDEKSDDEGPEDGSSSGGGGGSEKGGDTRQEGDIDSCDDDDDVEYGGAPGDELRGEKGVDEDKQEEHKNNGSSNGDAVAMAVATATTDSSSSAPTSSSSSSSSSFSSSLTAGCGGEGFGGEGVGLGTTHTPRVVSGHYRPPEVLLGARDYGQAVDVWSAGCIIAELCTRKVLFEGRDEGDQLRRLLTCLGEPPLPAPHYFALKRQAGFRFNSAAPRAPRGKPPLPAAPPPAPAADAASPAAAPFAAAAAAPSGLGGVAVACAVAAPTHPPPPPTPEGKKAEGEEDTSATLEDELNALLGDSISSSSCGSAAESAATPTATTNAVPETTTAAPAAEGSVLLVAPTEESTKVCEGKEAAAVVGKEGRCADNADDVDDSGGGGGGGTEVTMETKTEGSAEEEEGAEGGGGGGAVGEGAEQQQQRRTGWEAERWANLRKVLPAVGFDSALKVKNVHRTSNQSGEEGGPCSLAEAGFRVLARCLEVDHTRRASAKDVLSSAWFGGSSTGVASPNKEKQEQEQEQEQGLDVGPPRQRVDEATVGMCRRAAEAAKKQKQQQQQQQQQQQPPPLTSFVELQMQQQHTAAAAATAAALNPAAAAAMGAALAAAARLRGPFLQQQQQAMLMAMPGGAFGHPQQHFHPHHQPRQHHFPGGGFPAGAAAMLPPFGMAPQPPLGAAPTPVPANLTSTSGPSVALQKALAEAKARAADLGRQ